MRVAHLLGGGTPRRPIPPTRGSVLQVRGVLSLSNLCISHRLADPIPRCNTAWYGLCYMRSVWMVVCIRRSRMHSTIQTRLSLRLHVWSMHNILTLLSPSAALPGVLSLAYTAESQLARFQRLRDKSGALTATDSALTAADAYFPLAGRSDARPT